MASADKGAEVLDAMNVIRFARIDGADLFGEVKNFIARFVCHPSEHALIAHTAWTFHCHAIDAFESTPRLAALSPEPSSGKTRLLEITETLVPRPVLSVNCTPAYLFRKISDPEGTPTILYDEADTIFGPKSKKDNEEVRGVLNAGHRKGATAGRCALKGKTIETEDLPAYCAVALAGLGNLPDTIIKRSVVIRMRKRSATEKIEPYRRRVHEKQGNAIRDRLQRWANENFALLSTTIPDMPEGIEDRDADVWESLLAIAEVVGGDWREKVRIAAVALVAASKSETPSLGVKLLTDIKWVFEDKDSPEHGKDHIPTAELLKALHGIPESPWGNLRGEPIDARYLANTLKPYDVSSKNLKQGDKVLKGYARPDFVDAWARYVPSGNGATSATSATEKTGGVEASSILLHEAHVQEYLAHLPVAATSQVEDVLV